MIKKSIVVLLMTVIGVLVSCGVNSNLMLKQEKGVEVNSDDIPLAPREDYKIGVNDKIAFRIYAKDGYETLDPSEFSFIRSDIEYTVKSDGTVELPVIGHVNVKGLAIEECEDTLENRYSNTVFEDPFVKLQVTNQRVVVFPGDGGTATVISLENSNTTLMEAIALAGGIGERGKAHMVKLIRMENGERKVYVMDLSVIEGLKYTDLIVQSNDYIYVEPVPELAREILEKTAPISALVTTIFVAISLFTSL